jgi:hypothetical protein
MCSLSRFPYSFAYTTFSTVDVQRASAGAKLLMRFGASIIDKYNALPEEEQDINSILGHLVRMQVPYERVRLADVVGRYGVRYPRCIFSSSLFNNISSTNTIQ